AGAAGAAAAPCGAGAPPQEAPLAALHARSAPLALEHARLAQEGGPRRRPAAGRAGVAGAGLRGRRPVRRAAIRGHRPAGPLRGRLAGAPRRRRGAEPAGAARTAPG
ncbi:unnamed protein product, partial [Prorocentrum cordatum]